MKTTLLAMFAQNCFLPLMAEVDLFNSSIMLLPIVMFLSFTSLIIVGSQLAPTCDSIVYVFIMCS